MLPQPLESDYAPIGGPVGARRLYVLDAELNLVPQGAVGELYVGGLGLARGYLNNPALTADRFVADPFSSDGGRLYRTGDLVRWRSDGHLEYMGRLDHQIKIRGFRVELGEIEAQLLAQTGVREAVVLAHETAMGRLSWLTWRRMQGCCLTPSLLRASLGDVLPDYMIPSQFVFLEALPLGPNGKIDRKALPLPEQSGEQDYAPPVSAIEVIISEIWAEVLEVPRVGLHQNFFDLGGHSLLLIRVQSSLEKRLNTRIAIIELFKHTTVASLARFLGEETPAAIGSAASSGARTAATGRFYSTQAKSREELLMHHAEELPGRVPRSISRSSAWRAVFRARSDVEAFWRNLRDGVESITFYTDEELLERGVPAETLADPLYVKAGAHLEGVDLFDASFFGFTPREAAETDPQHRLFLEVAWQALEDAGYDASTYREPIGVYAGCGVNTYLLLNLFPSGTLLRHAGYLLLARLDERQ